VTTDLCQSIEERMLEEGIANRILTLVEPEGICLSEHQARLCAQHAIIMLTWNKRLNLTRITDINEILTKHLLDSLKPAQWLPGHGDAMDIGTGAGFPGVPLKVLRPGLKMVLLEAQRKKVSFLKVLLAKLQLNNIVSIQGRWQDFIRSNALESLQQFDVITFRALRLNPDQLATFSARTLKAGGVAAWWTGPNESETSLKLYNSTMSSAGLESTGSFRYQLPFSSGVRRISIWKKGL